MILEQVPGVDLIFIHESDQSSIGFVEAVNGNQPVTNLSHVVIAGRGGADPDRPIHLENFKPPGSDRMAAIPAYNLIDKAFAYGSACSKSDTRVGGPTERRPAHTTEVDRVEEDSGGPVATRTPDLYRVKVAL